jgi:putative GTP pyrophosphokinase
MAKRPLTTTEEELFNAILARFKADRSRVEQFLDNVNTLFTGSDRLMSLVHSVKRRAKTLERLRDKLERMLFEAEKEERPFDITPDNLYSKITDLAGYRILHLHTRQMDEINKTVLGLLDEAQYPLVERPKARIWDEESKSYFVGIGIETKVSPTLYSSVHYVIEANSKTKFTCEIQVRTLAEEIWGEVDHSFNYPHETNSIACYEQIKVLARVASSCSRLVDSIFRSYDDFLASKMTQGQQSGLGGAEGADSDEGAH